jgi:hypothetical protein
VSLIAHVFGTDGIDAGRVLEVHHDRDCCPYVDNFIPAQRAGCRSTVDDAAIDLLRALAGTPEDDPRRPSLRECAIEASVVSCAILSKVWRSAGVAVPGW